MSDIYYIVLSGLLGVILLVSSSNLRQLAAVGLCFWLFLICLVVSGFVGDFGGQWLARHALRNNGDTMYTFPPMLLALPFTMPLVAVATFSILYLSAALSVVRVIEKREKIELGKPSWIVSIMLAALSPFFAWPIYFHIFYPHG